MAFFYNHTQELVMKYILIVFASIKTGELHYQHGEWFDTPAQCISYVNNVYRHIDHKFFNDKNIGLKSRDVVCVAVDTRRVLK